jgi:predicted GNAT superfamily acetyltransferase
MTVNRRLSPSNAPVDADATVVVREVDDVLELEDISQLLLRVWDQTGESRPVTVSLLRALGTTGNYVCGAFLDGRVVGAAVGFYALSDGTLHSHITGVDPECQARNIGSRLKHHQREWARRRAINMITWTFDPLIRRNAYFNLVKLGATATGYRRNLYGEMHDALNRGEESDRLLVEWPVLGTQPRPEKPATVDDALALVTMSSSGQPQAAAWTGGRATVLLPADIEAVRSAAPDAARAWRLVVRDVLEGAIDRGARIVAFDRERGYVLEAPAADPRTGPR